MSGNEITFLTWLRSSEPATTAGAATVTTGIGDDMAELVWPDRRVLWASDMLLEGVHFESGAPLDAVGHKAIGVVLSDCAAMAARPCAALVSLALPAARLMEVGQSLITSMRATAARFDCAIVGGDTTAWTGPLVIDVAIAACPWPDCTPVPRHGARPGDAIMVSGELGGSRSGHHLRFEPRVALAHRLAADLGPDLHAMMDLSDGLGADLGRLCEASMCGATLDAAALLVCASPAARAMGGSDCDAVVRHVLGDGEDFELLAAVAPQAEAHARAAGLRWVGRCTPSGLVLKSPAGDPGPLPPCGFVHGQRETTA